jgi:hypothetical protein
MSVRFQDRPFTLTQPDGSTLAVRGSGNQFEATFETLDGKPVVLNPQPGCYGAVAPLLASANSAVPSASRNCAGCAASTRRAARCWPHHSASRWVISSA